jgi:calmodulin
MSTKDLGTAMRALGYNPTDYVLKVFYFKFFMAPKFMQAFIAEVDVDNSGSMDFSEFMKLMIKQESVELDVVKDIVNAFRVFDKDNTGFITVDELKNVMTNVGEKLTDDELEEMVLASNPDAEGKINYEAFVKNMTPPEPSE